MQTAKPSKILAADSETMRVLRTKFHNYSKSQQIMLSHQNPDRSTRDLKENKPFGFRQAYRSPIKNDFKPSIQRSTDKHTDYQARSRDLLAKAISRKITSSQSFASKTPLLDKQKQAQEKQEPKLPTRNDFKFHMIIGKGGFGKVWVVTPHNQRQYYALKEMSKAR